MQEGPGTDHDEDEATGEDESVRTGQGQGEGILQESAAGRESVFGKR